jgi:hypothetical protein
MWHKSAVASSPSLTQDALAGLPCQLAVREAARTHDVAELRDRCRIPALACQNGRALLLVISLRRQHPAYAMQENSWTIHMHAC